MSLNFRSKLKITDKLPQRGALVELLEFDPDHILVIIDRKLTGRKDIKSWLKQFDFVYEVSAGERLKDLEAFSRHVKKISRQLESVAPRRQLMLAVGGGSVGDFTGFLASVFKRGVPLVQVPTTLLAALDSAHGGKTGLNVARVKNQVGTFYPPQAVFISRPLLEEIPKEQVRSACGELFKMALLEGGSFWEKIKSAEALDFKTFWDLLPLGISAKYEIVERDPFEILGERQNLNLGHTLGHAIEAHYGLAHGLSVAHGLIFAICWSVHRGDLTPSLANEILGTIERHLPSVRLEEFLRGRRRMRGPQLWRLIAQDKKLNQGNSLNFIFLEGPGRILRRSVTLDSLVTEAGRQGWVSR